MGLNCGCLFSDCCDYIVCLHRQEDAETHVGDIWSDSGADGCRGCRRVAGLSDECLVGLSALVSAGGVIVNRLVSLSISIHVEKDACARCCFDGGRQYSVGRQCDAVPADKCFSDSLFGADACLTASMLQTMLNYQRSMREEPKVQQSWRESILPQVRSMAQPLVMVMPMLYAGMLLGGLSALTSLAVVLLLIGAAFVANVLAGVTALLMLRKK